MATHRTCVDCGTTVSRCSTGRCRPCSTKRLNNDPAIVERRRARVAACMARPEVKEAQRASMARYIANMPDADREARRERGKRIYRDVLNRPDVRAKSNSPDARRRAGQARSETVLGWCPPELREHYRDLVRGGAVRAAEARRIIEAEIPGTAEHAKREIASRQLASRLRHERDRAQSY